MRVVVVMRTALAGLVLLGGAMLAAAPAGAQEQEPGEPTTTEPATTEQEDPTATTEIAGQAIGGTLRAAGEPVEGATVTVTDAAGEEIELVETDEEGKWEVSLPVPGPYKIALDDSTLPEGISISEGRSSEVELNVRAGRIAQAAFPLTDEEADTGGGGGRRTFTDKLGQSIANGIKFGLIIAMTAVGLSLIFGTTGLVNFAHAELVTFGAIAAWFLNSAGIHIWVFDLANPMNLIVAAVITVGLGAVLGGVIDLGMFRPLRKRGTGTFQMLVISIGLSLALRQMLLIWFGERSLRYRDYAIQSTVELGPVNITPRDMWIIGLSVLTLLTVGAVLQYTRIGRATRAVADNPDLAESSGVDVQRIVLYVWMAGGALAALGGVFQGATQSVNYLNGFQLLLLMFAGVILGGLGTAFGAMVGSLVVGLATEVSTIWLSSEIKYVWALAVLVIVLLLRPQGILGVRERVG
jgi:neutral amino acid transport system permease protein